MNLLTKLKQWICGASKPPIKTKRPIKPIYDPFPPAKTPIDLSKQMSGQRKFQLKQRFPNFMTGFGAEVYHFDTLEEMLEAEFVKRWANQEQFVRFSYACQYKSSCLMVEQRDDSYWAIGYLKSLVGEQKELETLELPIWTKNKKQGETQ